MPDQSITLEGYCKYFLDIYLDHVKSTISKAHIILNYDKLRKETSRFYTAIHFMCLDLDLEYDHNIANESIEMSSFEKIREMEDKYNEQDGLAGGLKGYFTRDGRSGQYKEIMSEELINWIIEKWEVLGLNE